MAFDRAVELNGRPECERRRDLFADYDGAGSREVKDAKKICATCPIINECRDLAEVRRPGWGVWAARAWKDGKVVGKSFYV